jgi:small subunit ribosomal protein S1
VLAIDVERERISLGIKQLDADPFTSFVSVNDRGVVVSGKVKTVDPRGAEIQLNEDVTGYLRASEISRDRVEDARAVLKVGDEIEARFTGVDRKNRAISLSIKAKEAYEEAEAMQAYRTESSTGTSLGDLLKQQMSEQDDA